MTNIVGLRATSRAEVIASLHELIARAETDRTFTFVGYWQNDDECQYLWHGADAVAALGLSTRLTYNLNKWWDETIEEEL